MTHDESKTDKEIILVILQILKNIGRHVGLQRNSDFIKWKLDENHQAIIWDKLIINNKFVHQEGGKWNLAITLDPPLGGVYILKYPNRLNEDGTINKLFVIQNWFVIHKNIIIVGVFISLFAAVLWFYLRPLLPQSDSNSVSQYNESVERDNEAKAVELYSKWLTSNMNTDSPQKLDKYISYLLVTTESIFLLTETDTAWHNTIVNMLCDEIDNLNNIDRKSISEKYLKFLNTYKNDCHLEELDFIKNDH